MYAIGALLMAVIGLMMKVRAPSFILDAASFRVSEYLSLSLPLPVLLPLTPSLSFATPVPDPRYIPIGVPIHTHAPLLLCCLSPSLLKIKLCAWIAVFFCLMSLTHLKSSEVDYKQVMCTITFSGISIFINYGAAGKY